MCEVNDTGLKFAGMPLDPPLYTGMMKACLRLSGIIPSFRNFRKISVSGSARLNLHCFRRNNCYVMSVEGHHLRIIDPDPAADPDPCSDLVRIRTLADR